MDKSNGPSPAFIFDTINAYQRTAALKAATELDIFTHIAAGAVTSPEIASRAGAVVRGARILCDTLTVFGFLTKENGRYALTIDSAAFLDRKSPAYIGGALEF